jgi:chromosome segregation ATPase
VPQYFEMSCPQCGKGLRIRSTYVGLRLACKQCGHTFQFQGNGQQPQPAAAPPAAAASDLAPELAAARQRAATLEQELETARIELAAAKARVGELTGQLQSTAAAAAVAPPDLAPELEAARKRAAASEQDLENARAELSAATTRNSELAEQIQQLSAAPPVPAPPDLTPELEAARQRAATLEQDLETARAELATATGRVNELTDQLASPPTVAPVDLAPELDAARQRAAALESDIEKARSELAAATARDRRVSEQLQHKEADLGQQREQLKDALLQLAESRQEGVRAEEVLRERDAARSECDAAQRQVESLQVQVARAAELEKELTSARQEIARLESERQEIETSVRFREEETTRELVSARAQCARLSSELGGEVEELRGRLDAHATARSELDQHLTAARSEGEGARTQLEALRQELEAERAERSRTEERAQAELAAAEESRARVRTLESALEGVRRELEENRLASTQVLFEARGAWHAELDGRQSEWEAARQKLATEAEERLREQQARVAELERAVEALRRQITDVRQERDVIVQQLRKRLSTHDRVTVDLQRTREKREADARTLRRSVAWIASLQAECAKSRQGEVMAQVRWQELEAELRSIQSKFAETERCLAEARAAASKDDASEQENYEQHLAFLRDANDEERKKLEDKLKQQRDEIKALKATLEMVGIVV